MTSTRETVQPEAELVTEQPSLETVLQEIRQECQVRPDRYLEEVVVPFGGE